MKVGVGEVRRIVAAGALPPPEEDYQALLLGRTQGGIIAAEPSVKGGVPGVHGALVRRNGLGHSRAGDLAIEDLGGILERVKAGHKQRAVLHSWAFSQLRAFLEYKAALAGVPLFAVDPRNTSRECSACGHTDKRNRPNQSTFRCKACGHAEHADTNAARVISGRPPCKRGERVHDLRLSGLCVSSHSAS